jgi:hypothetical protein
MVDILLYFQFTFCSIEDYEEPVRLILKHHIDISDAKFQEVYGCYEKKLAYLEDKGGRRRTRRRKSHRRR